MAREIILLQGAEEVTRKFEVRIANQERLGWRIRVRDSIKPFKADRDTTFRIDKREYAIFTRRRPA